jgi:hypothetical protein
MSTLFSWIEILNFLSGTTKDLIDVLFNGFNCSVFVYGATGSGKTHTMLGKENNPGITLRTVVELYDRIAQVIKWILLKRLNFSPQI